MTSVNIETEKIKKKHSKSTIFIWILIGILVVLLAVGAYQFLTKQQQAKQLSQELEELSDRTIQVEQSTMYDSLESMSGTIRSNQSISLNWGISGTVSEIFVQTGDHVKKGDILAALDPASVDPSILEAAVTSESASEELDRLYTSSLNLATAYSNMITAKEAVQTAEDELDALGIVRDDSVEIGVYYQDYLNARSGYEKSMNNYEELKVRPLDDVDRQRAAQSLDGARSQMESALSMYNWYNGEVDSLEKQQAEANLLLAEAQYDDAVRAYEKIENGPTESQTKSLEAQIKSADATVNTAYIIAPVDATVAEVASKQFDIITIDSTTSEVFAIRLEDLSTYSIDVSVTEMDVNSVKVGQTAEITFDAVPLQMFTGKVVSVSDVGSTAGSSVVYDLTIEMDDTNDQVHPGMMADILIHTNDVENAKIVQTTAVGMLPSGERYVEKLNSDGTFSEVTVETGISSNSETQIITDQIQAGDLVKANLSLNQISDAANSVTGIFGMIQAGGGGGGILQGGGLLQGGGMQGGGGGMQGGGGGMQGGGGGGNPQQPGRNN